VGSGAGGVTHPANSPTTATIEAHISLRVVMVFTSR